MAACLCGAPLCNTPEAKAAREQIEKEREFERQLNREAFALYLADRERGNTIESPGWYRQEVLVIRTRALNTAGPGGLVLKAA